MIDEDLFKYILNKNNCKYIICFTLWGSKLSSIHQNVKLYYQLMNVIKQMYVPPLSFLTHVTSFIIIKEIDVGKSLEYEAA